MATEGSIYQRKSDGRWVAQHKDARGKTRYIYRKSKRRQRKLLGKHCEIEMMGLSHLSKMTLGVYLSEWFEGRRETISRRTWINQEFIIRRHVRHSPIGSQKLTKLSGRDRQWCTQARC